MNKAVRALSLWAPAAAWCALIFYLSHQPDFSLPREGFLNFALYKTAHVAEYAVLFALVFRAAAGGFQAVLPRTLLLSFLFCVFYAMTDEFHQRFVPGRFSKVRDVLLDALGAALAAGWIWRRKPGGCG